MNPIPDHWLQLAGWFLSESQGFDYGERFDCPEGWDESHFDELHTAVFDWLNDPYEIYSPEDEPLLNWMVVEYLGSLLQSVGTPVGDEAFATQTILVKP